MFYRDINKVHKTYKELKNTNYITYVDNKSIIFNDIKIISSSRYFKKRIMTLDELQELSNFIENNKTSKFILHSSNMRPMFINRIYIYYYEDLKIKPIILFKSGNNSVSDYFNLNKIHIIQI